MEGYRATAQHCERSEQAEPDEPAEIGRSRAEGTFFG